MSSKEWGWMLFFPYGEFNLTLFPPTSRTSSIIRCTMGLTPNCSHCTQVHEDSHRGQRGRFGGSVISNTASGVVCAPLMSPRQHKSVTFPWEWKHLGSQMKLWGRSWATTAQHAHPCMCQGWGGTKAPLVPLTTKKCHHFCSTVPGLQTHHHGCAAVKAMEFTWTSSAIHAGKSQTHNSPGFREKELPALFLFKNSIWASFFTHDTHAHTQNAEVSQIQKHFTSPWAMSNSNFRFWLSVAI